MSIAKAKSVLISGGSIAGPATAWWLNRYGFKTTVVERWSGLRPGGQGIDVNDQGRDIARRMGIEAAILAANTGEKGTVFTDIRGVTRVSLPLSDGPSGTNETEILRGDFAKILYDVTKEKTSWRFDDQIASLQELENEVRVEFQSGKQETFDHVVLADGVGSRTRKMAFGPDDVTFKPLGIYIAYFSIPYDKSESRSDQWIVAPLPGRRCISFRPDGELATKAFYMWVTDGSMGFEKLPYSDQINAIRGHLLGGDIASPMVDRAAKGLATTTDLYLEYTGQIKAAHLSTSGGRISMVGDCAYCGTAVSGSGTSLSLVGAYVLAGELAKNVNKPKIAASGYERYMKPFAADRQQLAPGIPGLFLPNSTIGIAILIECIRMVTFLAKIKVIRWIVGRFASGPEEKFPLPDYREYEIDEKNGKVDLMDR